jgi:sugar phosphate isomerase/epimerase
MKVDLAINLGFAVNRLTPPELWIPYVKEELGLNRVQFTADMLMPYLASPLGYRMAKETRRIADDYGVRITSTFTGAFTRLNHFSHPDSIIRDYWQGWFKSFAEISVVLGADSMGSHLGAQTIPDTSDPDKSSIIFDQTVACWAQLASDAKDAGLSFITWEPMSMPREWGETIAEAGRIQKSLNSFDLPILMCLDVDHGDVTSQDPDDTDPYVWLETYGKVSPLIHLKQSLADKGGHRPFTEEFNSIGKIFPDKVISALERSGAQEVELILELSFRERIPAEARMRADLKESVQFWQPVLGES